ncbi:MAG: hypothetical protein DRP08_05650, partial [Candidatus Aenigmatarchaeota archaeon]
MLSVQQLQRISKIFVYAEEVRKKHKIDGEEFTVGYLVGDSEKFPNWIKENLISKIKKGTEKGYIITTCPINDCGGEINLTYDEDLIQIRHKCKTCSKEYKLFISDEEIYRFLPTFIVSTVDKHSAFSGQRKYRNIIGGRLAECEEGHGYLPLGDRCEAGKK